MKDNHWEVETLILRFRDLVTGRGDTIKKHKEKCAEMGSVWWGWWSKAGEQVATDAFEVLKEKANAGKPLTIYLLDSGRQMIFQAQCIDIHWQVGRKPCPTPDKEKTPGYYKNQVYRAWFLFSDISAEPCSGNVVERFSYVRVDDFFEEHSSKYGDFYNKRIASIEELVQQNRSIWFIRDFRAGDFTHEIKLFDPRKIKPSHFIDEYIQTRSQNLLWVSDLHFSHSSDWHGFSVDDSDEVEESLGLRIEDALKKNKIDDLGGVIISGDITCNASREEFELANSFISMTSSWSKIENYQFALCPGNHDIAFSDDPSMPGSRITKAPAEARRHLGEDGQNTMAVLKFQKRTVKIIYYNIHTTNESSELRSIEIPYEETEKPL